MRYLSTLLAALFTSTLAFAQEAEMRSEFVYCSLNPEKTMADVIAQSQRYGEFSKAKGTKYAQAVMTPMHSGDTNGYDYILWGTWPDGEAMYNEWGSYANEYADWLAESSDEAPAGPASKCTRSVATIDSLVSRVSIPAEERDDKRPVQFTRCSLKDGVSIDQVYAQASANKEIMEEGGFKGWAISYLFPYMGFDGKQDFDFMQVNYWYSFDSRAHMAVNWLDFAEKNPSIEGDMSLLVSCEGSNSFVYESTFNNL
jgi:hypothetical protein